MTEEILPCMEIHTNFSEILPLRTKTTNKPFWYSEVFTSLSDISRHLWESPVLQSAVTNLASFQTPAISLPLIFLEKQ